MSEQQHPQHQQTDEQRKAQWDAEMNEKIAALAEFRNAHQRETPIKPVPLDVLDMRISEVAQVDFDVAVWKEKTAAAKAFVKALSGFQREAPKIGESQPVQAGPVRYRFAPLEVILAAIREPLAKHGLAVYWEISGSVERVQVKAVLMHEDGHSISSEMTLPPEGGRNKIQALGSAVTYGKRYTLTAVLGIESEPDTDGVTEGVTPTPADAKAKEQAVVKDAEQQAAKTARRDPPPPPPEEDGDDLPF